MRRLKRLPRWILIVTLLLASISEAAYVSAVPPQQEGFNATKAQRATVYVMQTYTNPVGQVVVSCVGSGTLVSAAGLILTNAHLALPSDSCRSDRIVIGLTIRIDEAPVATYYAQTVESNIGWDLAVLQITSTLDGRPVDRANLSLPFVEVINDQDAENLQLDSTINVVGYINDEKLSSASQTVRGTISGFTAEARIGDRAWIKTSAVIPGGMSGGGAYNTNGQLIGVPTIQPARSGSSALNCRRVQDSNGDGRIDDKDSCIPLSGFINALRPARLARGLILAAQLNIVPVSKPASAPQPELTGGPTFKRLLFAPGVNQAGMPTSVVTTMPTGTTRLYLFFDYDNMRDGMIYELRTTIDGVPNPTFSLAPATWSGGRQGLWYIGSTAQIWPSGTYDFSLFIEGVRAASLQIGIGGAARKDPAFSDILFGSLDSNGSLVSAGNVLPVGNTINAEFIYNNMSQNLPWRGIWYYQDVKLTGENSGVWKDPANGKMKINIVASATPFQPGRYRLELYLGEQMAATADFIMAGGAQSFKTEIFKNVTFASDFKDNLPSGVIGGTFANPIQQLYTTFDWHDLGPGIPWTWRWSVDNNLLFESSQPWSDSDTGNANWLKLATLGTVPAGSYKIELLVAGVVMGTATAKVGLGQLPPSIFGAAQGVQVQGTITDAETGKGISGVSFIVIKADFDSRDFTQGDASRSPVIKPWLMSEVYDLSLTDSQGNFTLSKLLVPEKDKAYSILVVAQGYLPVATDGISITARTKSPMILNVALNHD